MIICKKCGRRLSDDSLFCNGCGTKVEKTPSSSLCSHCGKTLPEDSAFCPFCGQKIGNSADKKASVSSVPEQTEAEGKALYSRGMSLFNAQKYSEALELLIQAGSICSDDAAIMYGIGECYRNLNDFDSAKKYYILSGTKGNPDGYSRVAYLYTVGTFKDWTIKREDDPHEAIEWFTRSLKMIPETASENQRIFSRLNNIGYCYARLSAYYYASLYTWTAFQYQNNSATMDNFQVYSKGLLPDQINRIKAVRNRDEMYKLMSSQSPSTQNTSSETPKAEPSPFQQAQISRQNAAYRQASSDSSQSADNKTQIAKTDTSGLRGASAKTNPEIKDKPDMVLNGVYYKYHKGGFFGDDKYVHIFLYRDKLILKVRESGLELVQYSAVARGYAIAQEREGNVKYVETIEIGYSDIQSVTKKLGGIQITTGNGKKHSLSPGPYVTSVVGEQGILLEKMKEYLSGRINR